MALPLVVALGISALAAILCIPKRSRMVALGVTAVSLGAACGLYGALSVSSSAEAAIGQSASWTLRLLSDSSPGEFGSSAYAEAVSDAGSRLKMQVRFSDDIELLTGTVVRAQGRPAAVREASRDFYWSQGVAATLNVSGAEAAEPEGPLGALRSLRARAIGAFAAYGGEQAGLLQALACGYRQTMDGTGAYEAYKTCGLAHLVAVSGAHLAIVTMLLTWLLGRLRVPKAAITICTLAFVAAYLVFAGIPISAVRAAFMVVLALSSSVARRRSASVNALALCIVAFLAADPATAVSVSFFLSAGSTLGILLFAGLIASWFQGREGKAREAVAAPLGMTLASNAVTLPYSMALFSQLPLIAPAANIVATPLFTIACGASLGAAIVACAIPPVAPAAIAAAAMAVTPLSAVVEALACIPYACIAVSVPQLPAIAFAAALCAILWIAWPQVDMRKAVAGIGCAAGAVALCIVCAPLLAPDQLVMLDVGQGDAFLLRSQGRAVLIDTGNQDARLRESLGKLGVTRLDAVVISHHDDDHMGSLASLAAYVQVGAVYAAAEALTCPCGHCAEMRAAAEGAAGPLLPLSVDSRMQVGRFALTCIWPDSFADEGGNGDSVCLKGAIDCDGDGAPDQTMVFLGDAESDELAAMMSMGRLSSADILKVGHHGSKVALTGQLVEHLDPQVALISCGAGNRYGHPSDEALESLACVGQVLRTDEAGTVALDMGADGIRVHAI